MRQINRPIALFVLACALALSACGKNKEEEAPVVNNLVEPPVENVIVEEPDAVLPLPSNNAVATPAPPPMVSEREQIQDDADASGMTARLPSAGQDGQPTDQATGIGE